MIFSSLFGMMIQVTCIFSEGLKPAIRSFIGLVYWRIGAGHLVSHQIHWPYGNIPSFQWPRPIVPSHGHDLAIPPWVTTSHHSTNEIMAFERRQGASTQFLSVTHPEEAQFHKLLGTWGVVVYEKRWSFAHGCHGLHQRYIGVAGELS